jgi:hypothetical protein
VHGAPNAQYNLASPDSLPVRIAGFMRRKMYERFLATCAVQPVDSILDVGVTSDQTYSSSNYVEAWYPHKDRLTAVGLDDASFLEKLYPGLKFRRANGLALPFDDEAFDVVHSSAVLEHVGGHDSQRQFIRELARVARRVAFLTTPNRWFPVEFHTVLPLVHWLPKEQFRKLLRRLGQDFLAQEANLNLLGRRELEDLSREMVGCTAELQSVHLLGLPSNLILVLHKTGVESLSPDTPVVAPAGQHQRGDSRPG